MKILVNAVPLLSPLTGIGQYTRHLFTAMSQLPEFEAQLTLFYGLHCRSGINLPRPDTTRSLQGAYTLLRRLVPNTRRLKRITEGIFFAHHARKYAKDWLYHEPSIIPHPYPGPTVISLHDLSCFDHPETHPAERVRLFHRELPKAVERVDHIIVISQSTRNVVIERFGIPPERISVTLLAADQRFRPRPETAIRASLLDFQLTPGSYLLSVGTLEPRKNLSTLFAAYARIPADLRKRYPLVVAGLNGWLTDDLLRNASTLIEKGEIRLLGYVPDESMPLLYAGAAAFAYPSRYEGFGLPPLEAMASGVPVVTSNRTSLPEVVGDAGLLLDPDDIDGFAENLRRILEDRQFAAELSEKGLKRASGFTWEQCARETQAVYRHVLQQRGIAL